MPERMIMRLFVAATLAFAVAGCGSSSDVDCHPATWAACVPTSARGCALAEVDGKVISAAACSGVGAEVGCTPREGLVCVADCNTVSDCRAP
jgi:hypothetical protein